MSGYSRELSIVVPVLNEAAAIPGLLGDLRQAGASEIIFVDGGSTDSSVEIIHRETQAGDVFLLETEPGRARQMNKGASAASGEVIIFLHADTRLPGRLGPILGPVVSGKCPWGRFDIKFENNFTRMRMVSSLMNFRSRMTGIATGDQAIFVRRDVFRETGGFKDIPLMEDIEFCRRLKRVGSPLCVRSRVTSSSRRWCQNGFFRTVFLMWGLRLAYWMGVPPDSLASWYRDSR